MPKRLRSYIGLGSNVGDPARALREALRALAALPGVRLAGTSSLYVTRPVGVPDQPDFHNGVAALDVPSGPDPETGALALLAALKAIERALGRQPRKRWGPREVDLDLLLFGDHVVSARREDGRWLEVPHPQMRHRLFVLAPLAELTPDLVPPGWPESVVQARDRRAAVEGANAIRSVHPWPG